MIIVFICILLLIIIIIIFNSYQLLMMNRYLKSLEKFVPPLKTGTVTAVTDLVAPLMNSIKMIHTIARYYSTPRRMGGLLRKTTNAMIQNCIMNIDRVAKASLQRSAAAAAAAANGGGGGGGGGGKARGGAAAANAAAAAAVATASAAATAAGGAAAAASGGDSGGGGAAAAATAGTADFWDSDLEAVSEVMESALRLNEVYLHECVHSFLSSWFLFSGVSRRGANRAALLKKG